MMTLDVWKSQKSSADTPEYKLIHGKPLINTINTNKSKAS